MPNLGVASLHLTPQEAKLWSHHKANEANIGKGGVRNPDGSISTVLGTEVPGPDGQWYEIPTVWDGKIHTEDEAWDRANRLGWQNFPSYPTQQAAYQRYLQMHQFMEQSAPNQNTTNPQSQPQGNNMGSLQSLVAQLRQKYGQSWKGIVNPQAGGMGQGGPRLAQEFNDMARTGVADPTISNIGRSAMFGAGLMSGSSLPSLGVELAANQLGLGSNPMPQFTGQAPVPNPNIRQGPLIIMRNDLQAAQTGAYNRGKIAEMGRRMGKSGLGAHGRGGFGRGYGGGPSPGGSSRGKRGE